MPDPTFGSIGTLHDTVTGNDFSFILLAQRQDPPGVPVEGLWDAMVISGRPFYRDGQLDPGEVAPIFLVNDPEIRWMPRAEPKSGPLTIYVGHPGGTIYEVGSAILTPSAKVTP